MGSEARKDAPSGALGLVKWAPASGDLHIAEHARPVSFLQCTYWNKDLQPVVHSAEVTSDFARRTTMLSKITLALVFAIAVTAALPASSKSSLAGPYCVPYDDCPSRHW
jgi:hypothetical protein